MDLGATVCVPRAPRCLDCPVSEGCVGYRKGIQDSLPVRRHRKPLPHHHHATVVVLVADQTVWIRQRPAEGLLGGLWEFPSIRADEGDVRVAATTLLNDVWGLSGIVLHPAWQIAHAFTHFKMTLHVFVAPTEAGHSRRLSTNIVPVAVSDLPHYPFSASMRKIALKLSERVERQRRDRLEEAL
jgi:A/G-specific adenine glycosylase